jgi:predicted transposase/invertase (TIGR01784 family)
MDCRTKEEFSDDLRLIYLTLPKFNKEELECSDELEHWLFSLKHMETMEQLPTGMKGTIFEDLWNKMDYYSLPFEDRIMYDRMMMRKADEKNSLATSRKRGREEGLKEGEAKGLKEGQREEKLSTARKMIAMDFPLSQISQITGLSLEELEQLK